MHGLLLLHPRYQALISSHQCDPPPLPCLVWVSAMELDILSPNMTQLLMDMGVQYDPDWLVEAL